MNTLFRAELADKKPSVVEVPHRKRMMCLNESCMDPYPQIKDHFLKRMKDVHLNRYMAPITDELHRLLTDYVGHGLSKENITWGSGADDMLYHTFLSARKSPSSFAVSLAPSYFDFKTFCDMVGLGFKQVDLNPDFSLNLDAYLSAASDPDCSVAVLCNPNNPTGNLFPKEQLRAIIQSLPDKLILMDETYYEFCGESFVDELHKHPNLILVRSFSKAFSAAGLRFGYAISSKQNIYNLRKVFLTFHSSILVQNFALSVLENIELFQMQVQDMIQLREQMYHELRQIPQIKVHPSATNFVAFTSGDKTAQLFEYLKDKDIALRDISSHPLLKNHLRATLSCQEDNAALIQEIKSWIETCGA